MDWLPSGFIIGQNLVSLLGKIYHMVFPIDLYWPTVVTADSELAGPIQRTPNREVISTG